MSGRLVVPEGFREVSAAEAGEVVGGGKWEIIKKLATYAFKYTMEHIDEAVDGFHAGYAAGGCGCR